MKVPFSVLSLPRCFHLRDLWIEVFFAQDFICCNERINEKENHNDTPIRKIK